MQGRETVGNPFIDQEKTQNPYLEDQCCPTLAKSATGQPYSWIDEYLNPEVLKTPFYQVNDIKHDMKHDIKHEECQLPDPDMFDRQNSSKQIQIVENGCQLKNKSIFHNFQKHVITLLKRIAIVKRVELLNESSGLKAYQLWKIFKISKDFTKKTLYMVFGVAEDQNIKNLQKLAQRLPDLQKMLEKCTIEDIQEAQALLRQKIGQQISQIKKQIIKRNCKMEKFQQFYSYFQNFIEQLSNEGLSKRLRKDQKIRLVESNINLAQQRK